ncbi:MAG TPA: tRNA uridine-5-carboxymethylaminomethyl(34) synthesis GTPase MnmE [Gemmatimonadaceae bacterium]
MHENVLGNGSTTPLSRSTSRSPSPSIPLPGAGDTIAALATPGGRGALAVLRLSGPDAYSIASRVITPWRAEPRAVHLVTLRDPASGKVIDRPVVTVYAAPRSYTGEDLVELSVHGGLLVPVLALGALLGAGAREALPGEFTRRAVANGKMDILQAEGVGDLIDAQSRAMHDAAIGQLEGSLSRRIAALRDAVIALEALIAYDIDFPEEDDGPIPAERVERGIAELLAALDALLATAATGEMIRRGALVVIAGAPNAGKSSLFNALLGSTRAIVTDIPGTTRDAIEAVADVGSWPVRLVDTAGLRETSDIVERLGIEVSERYLGSADAVLACGESEESLALTASRVRALTSAPVLSVRTKSDLVANRYEMASGIAVSAATGAGLGELADAMARLIAERYGQHRYGAAADRSAPLLTRERHRVAVQSAREEVADFERAWREGSLPATVAAVHLHAAATALESLIGGVDVEDVLDRVFSDFCVGK